MACGCATPSKKMEDQLHCGGCKSLEEVIYWKHIKRLRFCVVLRSDFQDKLPIPKKFADNMRPNILHPKMTLKGPSGASWEVTLMSTMDGLFIQDGWEDFVNAYSLQENDILFFKYDRSSSFDVKIFNGECEREAAYFVKKCGHVSSAAIKDQKKRDSSEVVDEGVGNGGKISVTTKKARVNYGTEPVNGVQNGDGLKCYVRASKKLLSRRKPIQWALRLLRKRAASSSPKGQSSSLEGVQGLDTHTDQNGSTNKGVASTDQNPSEVTEICTPNAAACQKIVPHQTSLGRSRQPYGSSKNKASSVVEYISNRRRVTEQERDATLRKAVSELTENSFLAAMPNSACYKAFFMTIPAKFAAKHFGSKNEDVILCVGEKKWLTGFSFSRGGLGPGWKEFALDNGLEEADACLFKLVGQVDCPTLMLDVTIFRVVEEVTPPTLMRHGTSLMKASLLDSCA